MTTPHRLTILSLTVASAFALSGCGGSPSSFSVATPNQPTTVSEPPAPQAAPSTLVMVTNNPTTQQAKVLGISASGGAIPRIVATYGTRIGSLVSSADGQIYLLDGANTLHTISSSGAEEAQVAINKPLQGLQLAPNGMLVGIAYNEDVKQNELYRIAPSTGDLTLLKAFAFDGDAYIAGSFISDPMRGVAYAISVHAPSQDQSAPLLKLYTFDLVSGQIASPVMIQQTALDGLGIALSTRGRLLVSTYDLSADSTVLSQLDIATGVMTPFASAPASEGKWRIVSLVSDDQAGLAYLATDNRKVYKLNLTTGELGIVAVDGPLDSIQLLQLGGPATSGFVTGPGPGNTDNPVPPPTTPPVAPPSAPPAAPPAVSAPRA